jgi:hypothetical protein
MEDSSLRNLLSIYEQSAGSARTEAIAVVSEDKRTT